MFYSHESESEATLRIDPPLIFGKVLTSREGGIATVWYIKRRRGRLMNIETDFHRLVATLGSKTNNRKVNRKSILEVDVKKTCDIITQPEAPMALRLQGNLLWALRP